MSLADDAGIGAEGAAPQSIAEDHDRMLTRRDIVPWEQGPAELGTDTQHLEVVSRHQLTKTRSAEDPSPG